MKKNVAENRMINVVTLLIYKVLLDYVYVNIIVPVYGYSGFSAEYNFIRYMCFFIIYILFIPLIMSLYKKVRPSNIILLIFFLVGFSPGITLFSFMPQPFEFVVLFICYWLFLVLFNKMIPQISLKDTIGSYNFKTIIFPILVFFFFVIIIFTSGKYAGFRINLNLLNVYELRSEFIYQSFPTIIRYGFAAAKVCNPLVFMYFVIKKRKMFALFSFFIQVLAFSVDGSKSTLFSIIAVYFTYKFVKTIKNEYFVFILFGITLVSYIEDVVLGTGYIVLFFIRRLMFIPNLLHTQYFDFFKDRPKDYFAQSILGDLGLESQYQMKIPNLIGLNYYNSELNTANNGLFSDAYYNLGAVGVVFMPFLLIIVFRIMDSIVPSKYLPIALASIITVSYTFISSSFFVVLLTHGYLITCLLLFSMIRDGSELI